MSNRPLKRVWADPPTAVRFRVKIIPGWEGERSSDNGGGTSQYPDSSPWKKGRSSDNGGGTSQYPDSSPWKKGRSSDTVGGQNPDGSPWKGRSSGVARGGGGTGVSQIHHSACPAADFAKMSVYGYMEAESQARAREYRATPTVCTLIN